MHLNDLVFLCTLNPQMRPGNCGPRGTEGSVSMEVYNQNTGDLEK